MGNPNRSDYNTLCGRPPMSSAQCLGERAAHDTASPTFMALTSWSSDPPRRQHVLESSPLAPEQGASPTKRTGQKPGAKEQKYTATPVEGVHREMVF